MVRCSACPCCKDKGTVPFVTYKALPEILFPVDEAAWDKVARADLPLHSCSACGHIFQQEIDLTRIDRIYRDLYRFYPYRNLESFAAPYREPFEEAFTFLSEPSCQDKRLLEIGCSSSESMKAFLDRGYQCTGVDPSSRSANDGPIRVVGERYERVRFEEPFDTIVLRFVLEHIVDLDELLHRIGGDLNKGGRIYVQVPNVHQWMNSGTLCIGAHEHIHYFTLDSLLLLFRRFGYEVVYHNGSHGPSMVACFERGHDRSGYRVFQSRLSSSDDQIQTFLNPCHTVCFYGAGLQLMWLLYCSRFETSGKKFHVVDDNEILVGRFLPALGVPVQKLSREVIAESDGVVLTLNSIYHENAIRKLSPLCTGEKRVFLNQGDGWKEICVGLCSMEGQPP